jgi:hypothetical protein
VLERPKSASGGRSSAQKVKKYSASACCPAPVDHHQKESMPALGSSISIPNLLQVLSSYKIKINQSQVTFSWPGMLDCVLHTSPSVDEPTLAFPAMQDTTIEGAVPGRLINPVMTMNKKSITRVYFRKIPRKGNAQKESVNAPVFDSVMPDYEIPRTYLNQTLASLKRIVTPVSV